MSCLSGRCFAEPDVLIDFRQIDLDNGLRVITSEDFSCPIVAVHLWYHVGSKDEQPERQGFAHMFEHMMFRGTDTLGPTDHFDYIRRTGGTCNAHTSFDETVYEQELPANQLELALWLECQRMTFLKIDQEAFDTERKVVEEERRLGMNRPYGMLMETLMAEVFKVHPYRWTPIGQIPHLRASEVRELRDFWTRYYVPNNATLVIVGAVKHDTAQQLARKHFGWIPRYPDPPRVTAKEPAQHEARQVNLKDESAPAPLVGMFFRTVPVGHSDQVPLQMLGAILGGDSSSRLYRELVVKQKRAMMTMNMSQAFEQDGMFVAFSILNPVGGKPEVIVETVTSEVARMRSAPVSADELTKARNQELNSMIGGSETIAGKAALLGRAAVLEGGANRVNQRLAEVRGVTAADIQRVAQAYLAPERSTILKMEGGEMLGGGAGAKKGSEEDEAPITAKPETESPAPGRGTLNRPAELPAAAPVAGRLEFNVVPEHQRETLANGLKVIVVPNREVPMVGVQLHLRSGAVTETKPGTASMALGMLTEGTAKHSEAELAAELGQYAISLSGFAGLDSAGVSLACLTEQLERGMNLLAEVVLQPTFPESEFDRARTQARTGLQMQSAQPEYIAQREFRKRLYGDHPYARSPQGEAEDLDALKTDDLRGWWQQHARPDQAVLVFAGDIALERAMQLAETSFGGWKAEGAPPEISFASPPPASTTQIVLIDRRGTQSEIVVGQLGIGFQHPQYFTAQVVSGYFGGAFSSRLNETIRVKLGLTYGARGGFSSQSQLGAFQVRTFSKTASTAQAVQAVFDELQRLTDEAPSDEELGKTRSYMLGSFPLERETAEQIGGDLWLMERNALPVDFFQRQFDAVSQVSKDDCVNFAKSAVDPTKMVVVVVGKASELKESLEKIAPVTVIERKSRRRG